MSQNNPTLNDVLEAVLGVQAQLSQVKFKVDSLDAKLGAQSAQLDAQVARLDAQVARLDAQVAQLDAQGAQFDAQGARFDARDAQIDSLAATLDAQSAKQDELRVVLMDRMDRLQDAMTEQRDDMTVLLGLIDGTQRIAERGLSEARAGFDQNSRLTSTMITLERQVRRLQDEVKELRGRRSGVPGHAIVPTQTARTQAWPSPPDRSSSLASWSSAISG